MVNSPERLAGVFVELADTLVAEFDTVEFLQMLTERCVELLEVGAAGLVLADAEGHLQAMASTIDLVHSLELFELQNDEGPCLDCFATGIPLVNVDLDASLDRWPVFAAAALASGYHLAHALPMRLRDQVIGAVNLFSTDRSQHLTPRDVSIGQAMADIATIGLLSERAIREGDVLARQLQTALDSRVLVEQAKGVLAERAGIDVRMAFTLMRRHARNNSLPLSAVATMIINGTMATRDMLRH